MFWDSRGSVLFDAEKDKSKGLQYLDQCLRCKCRVKRDLTPLADQIRLRVRRHRCGEVGDLTPVSRIEPGFKSEDVVVLK